MTRSERRGLPRVADICLAALGLFATSPLLAAAAIAVKLTSGGPAVFRQKRVGRNGETFTLFKLRTMTAGTGARVTAAGDSRVTLIGRLLRRFKIDELPQLWNVVRGDMSIVGPRPEVPELVDAEDPRWIEILEHRPGLTDPVTIKLRNEEHLLANARGDESFYENVIQPYKIKGYLSFVRNRTVTSDIKLIGSTVTAIVLPGTAAPPSREELLLSPAE